MNGWQWLFLTLMPTIVLALITLALMQWHVRTAFELKLTARGVAFEVGRSERRMPVAPITRPITFTALSVQHFRRADSYLASVWTTRSEDGLQARSRRSNSILARNTRMSITGGPERLQPTLTVERVNADLKAAGSLDAISMYPESTVELAIDGQNADQLTIKLRGPSPTCSIGTSGPCLLRLEQCTTAISNRRSCKALQTYGVTIHETSPCLTVVGAKDSLLLYLLLPPNAEADIFTDVPIPIKRVTCIMQSIPTAETISALTEDAQLRFSDYPSMKPRCVSRTTLLDINHLDETRIERIQISRQKQGVQVETHGVVPDGDSLLSQYRLTVFDVLVATPWLAVLLGILLWVFPTTLSFYQFIREGKQ